MKNSHEIAYKLIDELRDYASSSIEDYIKLLIYKGKNLDGLWELYNQGTFVQIYQHVWREFLDVDNIRVQLEDIKDESAEDLITKLSKIAHTIIKEYIDIADQKKLNEMWNTSKGRLTGWHNKLLLEIMSPTLRDTNENGDKLFAKVALTAEYVMKITSMNKTEAEDFLERHETGLEDYIFNMAFDHLKAELSEEGFEVTEN